VRRGWQLTSSRQRSTVAASHCRASSLVSSSVGRPGRGGGQQRSRGSHRPPSLVVYDLLPCIWDRESQTLTVARKLFHRANIHRRLKEEMRRETLSNGAQAFFHWQHRTESHCACLQSTIEH
jgi:hypothetical protein